MLRKSFFAAAFLSALALSGPGTSAPDSASAPGPVPLAQLPRVAIPQHYRLALTIDPEKSSFSGHDEIDVDVRKPLRTLYIDGNEIEVKTAVVKTGGKTIPATYKQVDKSGVSLLTFASEVPAGRATLVFDYTAPYDTSLAGLYKVSVRGDNYAFTQFEDIDARRAFVSFDEPGFKTPFDITITSPTADKVIGNTRVIRHEPVAGGMTRWTFETTKPLPTYLVAMAVGPLDIVDMGDIPPNKYRDHPLHLRGVAARGMGPKLKYALSLTPSVIETLENYYGIGYPFQKVDILAVPDFEAGAMENAGAVTFREQLLLMGPNAPMDQKRSSLDVQAHELAHQWFGDYVTPTWWDNIWLNESFATWMEYKISAMVRPDEEFGRSTEAAGLRVMRLDELPSARQIHNPVHNPDDIENAFDQITYAKGGAVLAMFEAYVGPKDWQKGIHAYLTKFAYRNATAQDFIGTIAQATNHPEIVGAFNSFIDQPGIPQIDAAVHCANGAASADVTEKQYAPVGIKVAGRTWKVPACFEVDGKRICHMIAGPMTKVDLGSKCPSLVFPNANGSGYYRFGAGDKGWQTFVANAAKLSPAGQLAVFANADAAMRAGEAKAGMVFSMIHALAPAAQWDTVDAIAASLHELRATGIIGDAGEPALVAFVNRNFSARLKALGLAPKAGESVADSLLREALTELLVEEGHDPALTAQLSKAAQVFVRSGGKDLGGIAPEIAGEAMRAAVKNDPAFANSVFDLLQKSDDEYLQGRLIAALAASNDEAVLKKLAALALSPHIRIGDIRYILGSMPQSEKGRTVLWTWFKANFEGVKKRVSAYGIGEAAGILGDACDARSKSELNAFFGPRIGEMTGGPRNLREVNDQIDRCIAFKQAKGAEIAAALKSAP